jgi:hypothetical protein
MTIICDAASLTAQPRTSHGRHARRDDDLGRLLRPLERIGDRVFIVMDEKLRGLLPIDSSVFNVVLAQPVKRPERL